MQSKSNLLESGDRDTGVTTGAISSIRSNGRVLAFFLAASILCNTEVIANSAPVSCFFLGRSIDVLLAFDDVKPKDALQSRYLQIQRDPDHANFQFVISGTYVVPSSQAYKLEDVDANIRELKDAISLCNALLKKDLPDARRLGITKDLVDSLEQSLAVSKDNRSRNKFPEFTDVKIVLVTSENRSPSAQYVEPNSFLQMARIKVDLQGRFFFKFEGKNMNPGKYTAIVTPMDVRTGWRGGSKVVNVIIR
jgi:hypothetical protein